MEAFRKVSVAQELERNPELRKEDIQEIRDWMETLPHLPEITDSEIVLFLHSNFHNIEETKATIVKYFDCRTQYKEFFSNLDLSSDALVQVSETITLAALPKRTPEGYKVIYGKLWSYEPSKFNVTECAKAFTMLIDAIHLKEGTQEGMVLCFDMNGCVFGHVFRIPIFGVKHYLHYLQEAMPVRMKKIHFFNLVPFVDKILAIVRPFMKQSLWDILELHDKIDTVYESIPPEVFPSDYPNGTASSIEEYHDTYFKDLLDYQDYYTEEEQTRRIIRSPRKSILSWFTS